MHKKLLHSEGKLHLQVSVTTLIIIVDIKIILKLRKYFVIVYFNFQLILFQGQSSDEALKKLLQQAQPTGMVSEATKSSISLSTEYGNSNDALLAALLKEQGFGPTTASSIDEQLRLAVSLSSF